MFTRREFLKPVGVAAVSSVLLNARAEALPGSSGIEPRSRVSLNDTWQRFISGVQCENIEVPSSLRPSGYYELKRKFLLPVLGAAERAILHFEAIAYRGKAFINGKELGVMGPYIPYEFDATPHLRVGTNEVTVAISDLQPDPRGAGKSELAMGVNPGWEAYGGIIRDVYLEVRHGAYIDNLRLAYDLTPPYASTHCRVTAFLSSAGTTSGVLRISLLEGKEEVAFAERDISIPPGQSESELAFDLKTPALWSPDVPNLYELTAKLETSGGTDRWSCKAGFRDIRTEGREFRLNGKKLVLNGICRHDMWRDQGFTLSRAQQDQDMRMIKGQGCNFIRLVHYPHDRRIIELADQLGLLVSEEPGYWGMDFNTMERPRIDLGYTILEAIIRRDWNSPSVMAWLLANECTLTEAFLKEGKQRCNKLDPIKRLVSAANNHDAPRVKPIFEGAGMDFFDQHPYTFDVEDFAKAAEVYGPSKPLIFSEWGGKAIGQAGIVMRHTVDRLIDLVETGELSGHAFWSWQDMRQYSRIDPEMRDGILESGVVTESREPRDLVAMELTRLFELRRHVADQPDVAPGVVPLTWAPWSRKNTFESINLQPLVETADARRAWTSFKSRMAKYWEKVAKTQWKRTGEDFLLWKQGKAEVAGVDFQFPLVNDRVRPLILTPEVSEIVIPVKGPCQMLHILGQVTFGEGFPLAGKDGEKVASYILEHSKGKNREIPLRNGYEIVQANLVRSASRLDLIATEAQRALMYVKDISREQYQILLYSVPVREAGLVRVRCKLHGEQPPLAIFAITMELPDESRKQMGYQK
jgi:hypothetical protein